MTTYSHAMRIGTSSAFGGLRFPYTAGVRSLNPLTVGLLVRTSSPTGAALFGIGEGGASSMEIRNSSGTPGDLACKYSRASVNQTFTAPGVITATDGAWRWIFVTFGSTRTVFHGDFNGTLTSVSLTSETAGSGAFETSGAHGPWIGSDGATYNSLRECDVAFCGLWNSTVSLATAQDYADDMSGNGGLAAAVEYWKWTAGDTAGITGSVLGITATYTAPASLITGPGGSGGSAAFRPYYITG
jgi:hypothetical protein